MKENRWDDFLGSKITPNREIEGGNVHLSYKGSEIFVEGTMSCIVGQAKSRKTFALSLLLEQLLKPSIEGMESSFIGDILYFDTEMSPLRVQNVSKRFTRPENMNIFSIRQYSIKERYELIEESIKRLRPHIVVIDGFKELTQDINDQVYSTKLTNKILQWTSEYDTHITGILHTNPESSKPRGALGTEIVNKSSLVLHCQAKGPSSRLTTLFSRDKEVDPITFRIDEKGNPVVR